MSRGPKEHKVNNIHNEIAAALSPISHNESKERHNMRGSQSRTIPNGRASERTTDMGIDGGSSLLNSHIYQGIDDEEDIHSYPPLGACQ